MSKRVVNIFAGIVSLSLVLLYLDYAIYGPIYDITFAFPALLAITATYIMLAVHQTIVAVQDNGKFQPFAYPVPFAWVLASLYISFTILLIWVVVDYFARMPLEPLLRRGIWLQAALMHVWFFRRFVMWSRPIETRHERDIRQDARQERQDHTQEILEETNLSLAETGKINAARNQRISLKGVELDERIMKLADAQRVHDAEGVDQAATGVLQDATDVRQDEREIALDERDKE